MTAEVAVMNRCGIALAADSAVTISLGPKEQNIYTSAEKLFLLSERAPIGLMIYGDADLLDVPWETVVSLYRRQLGTTVHDSLADYAQGLLQFLEGEQALFPDEVQRTFVEPHAWKLYTNLREKFEQRLADELDPGELDEDKIRAAFARVVREELKRARERLPLKALPDDFPAVMGDTYQELLDGLIDAVMKDLPRDQATARALRDYVCEVLSREHPNAPKSGIVIAGFGECEHYPSLVEYELRGIAAGHLLFQEGRRFTVGQGHSAFMAAFAQEDMVQSFMDGIHPEVRAQIRDSTAQLFHGMFEVITGEVCEHEPHLKELFDTKLAPLVKKSLQSLYEEWDQAEQDQHSYPVMNMVEWLPKGELAGMAEALVNLTKLRRHVSTDLETVGGPVDVAVISKADGFIWIKRKDYFPPELNQHRVTRYDRDAQER